MTGTRLGLRRLVSSGWLLGVLAGCTAVASPAHDAGPARAPSSSSRTSSPGADPARGYTFLNHDASDRVTRWDPCAVLHYVVDPQGAPKGGMRDILAAVAQVSASTGIRFAFDRFVSERPSLRRAELGRTPPSPGRNSFQPVLIGWYSHGEAPAGAQDVVGYAAPVAEYDGNQRVYVSGLIGIRRDAGLAPGFDGNSSVGGVLLHELGHLMGLGHVADDRQIMYPRTGHPQVRLATSPVIWPACAKSGGPRAAWTARSGLETAEATSGRGPEGRRPGRGAKMLR